MAPASVTRGRACILRVSVGRRPGTLSLLLTLQPPGTSSHALDAVVFGTGLAFPGNLVPPPPPPPHPTGIWNTGCCLFTAQSSQDASCRLPSLGSRVRSSLFALKVFLLCTFAQKVWLRSRLFSRFSDSFPSVADRRVGERPNGVTPSGCLRPVPCICHLC